MKRFLLVAVIVALSCSMANAAMIVGFERSSYDANLDKIDFHITGLTEAQAGLKITSLNGTWAAMEADAKLSMSSSGLGWKGATMLDNSLAGPAAPQSFVNFNTNTGDLTRTGGTGTLWQSWQGGYYTLETAAYLSPQDPDLSDGFDQTLLATIYVTKGKNVSFVGGANPTVTGTRFDVAFDTIVPEPGTIALLASGAIGLLVFAWRKRE